MTWKDWTRFLVASLCVHLLVFWPVQRSTMPIVMREPLQVRIVSSAVPQGVSANGEKVSRDSGERRPSGLKEIDHPVRPVIGGVIKSRRSNAVSAQLGAKEQSLHVPVATSANDAAAVSDVQRELAAYKYALALATLEFAPLPDGDLRSELRGIVVVDIRFVGSFNSPTVSLNTTSGKAEIDTIALKMVRRALEKVPPPSHIEARDHSLRLSVVLEDG